MKQIEKEIMLYELEFDELPLTLADIGLDSMLDPWGIPYQYLNFSTSILT